MLRTGGVGTPEEWDSFHDGLRNKMSENLFWDFVNPRTIYDYT